MKRALKWTVPVDDNDHPIGSGKVLLVACQTSAANAVQVWTEETPVTEGIFRRARIYGTGQVVPEGDEHIGSALTASGSFVWHVFGSPR